MDLWRGSRQLGQHIRHASRLTQIVNVLARHGLASLIERSRVMVGLSKATVRAVEEMAVQNPGGRDTVPDAARLRRALEALGPAFVKLGQVLALREDLLPPPYIEELCKLHSSVEFIPFSLIEKVLHEELGAEKLADFLHIDPIPIAAGSIGQVHAAELKGGRRVVLKVQRPGIAQIMKVDLALMVQMAGLIERHIPELRRGRPRTTIEEFARATLGELDYVREAANTTKFATNLAALPYLKIPEVQWDYSSPRVLTLSFLAGEALAPRATLKAKGYAPTLVLERGVLIFMKMVFEDGFFHGDLHPGNFMVLPFNDIGLLDFGVAVRLSRSTREHLAGLLAAMVNEDFEEIVNHFVELTCPDASFDADAFTHELANAAAPFLGLSLKEMRAGKVLWDLARIAARHGAPMNGELILFLRNLVCLESIAAQLDPGFDIIKSCQPLLGRITAAMYSPDYLKREGLIIARDLAQLARHAPFQLRRLMRTLLEGDLRVNIVLDDSSRWLSTLDRAARRLTVAIVCSAMLLASSILILAESQTVSLNFALIGSFGLALALMLGLGLLASLFRGDR